MQRPYAPFRHNVDGADHARAFRVTDAGTNNVSVAAGRVRIDQTVTNFAAATPLGPLGNGTHFVYIDNGGNITSNLGGPYPAQSIPLARVVVAAGDVTGITDDRCFFYEDTAVGGGGYDTIKDEGGALPQRTTIDFVGAGVTAADVAGETQVTIPGGGGGGTLDAAYDFGGLGAGRTINATDGSVLITNADADPGVPNLELARAVAYVAEPFLGIRATGDAAYRFTVDGNGRMQWGAGAGAADVVLSRAAVNHLALAAGDYLRLQYIADTAGGTRITTAAASPNVTVTGATRLEGAVGIMSAPFAPNVAIIACQPVIVAAAGGLTAFALSPTVTTNFGDNFPGLAALQGLFSAQLNATTNALIQGLNFIAQAGGASAHANSVYDLAGLIVKWQATNGVAGTLAIASASTAVLLGPFIYGTVANITVTAGYGLWIKNQGDARVTTSIALYIAAQSGSGTNRTISALGTAPSIHQPAICIGANAAPAASAVLELQSTTGALLLPRMTTVQKNALAPANGMGVYDTTLNRFEKYQAGAWVAW